MWSLRERAEQEATKQNIWALVNLPGFDVWFQDWTTPKAHRGKRYLVPLGGAALPSGSERNGKQATESANGQPRLPGRPSGSKGKKAERRRAKVIRDWQSGEYDSIQAVATANHINRSTASKILGGAGLTD
jgi:hypothetical protein